MNPGARAETSNMVVESRPLLGAQATWPLPTASVRPPLAVALRIRGLELHPPGTGRVGMKPHESAAWLYGFLAAVRRGDLYAPPHVVEMVERALERYEHTRATRGEWGLAR